MEQKKGQTKDIYNQIIKNSKWSHSAIRSLSNRLINLTALYFFLTRTYLTTQQSQRALSSQTDAIDDAYVTSIHNQTKYNPINVIFILFVNKN